MDAQFIFMNDFTVIGIIKYNYLKWVQKFYEYGEFAMEVLYTMENYNILKQSNIVYMDNSTEAMFITSYIVTKSQSGTLILSISGKSLESLMLYRIAHSGGTSKLNFTINLINDLIYENLIGAADIKRRYPYLRFKPGYSPPSPPSGYINAMQTLEYENQTVYELVLDLCRLQELSVKCEYNYADKAFDYLIDPGTYPNDLLINYFVDAYHFIQESDYSRDESNYRNMCYVYANDMLPVTVNDTLSGFNRRETYLNCTSEITLPTSMQTQGLLYLNTLKVDETIDAVLNLNVLPYIYRRDFKLGARLPVKVAGTGSIEDIPIKRLIEVAEYYDKGGYHLVPVFE
jgi:hypothetical protein